MTMMPKTALKKKKSKGRKKDHDDDMVDLDLRIYYSQQKMYSFSFNYHIVNTHVNEDLCKVVPITSLGIEWSNKRCPQK